MENGTLIEISNHSMTTWTLNIYAIYSSVYFIILLLVGIISIFYISRKVERKFRMLKNYGRVFVKFLTETKERNNLGKKLANLGQSLLLGKVLVAICRVNKISVIARNCLNNFCRKI